MDVNVYNICVYVDLFVLYFVLKSSNFVFHGVFPVFSYQS